MVQAAGSLPCCGGPKLSSGPQHQPGPSTVTVGIWVSARQMATLSLTISLPLRLAKKQIAWYSE